jgi:large repetitive protein
METRLNRWPENPLLLVSPVVVIMLLLSIAIPPAMAATLSVMGVHKDGSEVPVTEYRWQIQEDATHRVVPNDPTTNFATDFHRSYMPVVASGNQDSTIPELDPNKHYFVSVIPNELGAYSVGGAPLAGDGDVTVYLNQLPIPTAQITIFAFEDNHPINNAPDLPAERGLEGFSVLLEDAGGRYGISAGQQMMDAFGNMLGTVYQRDADGNYILDDDGQPVVAMMGNGIILTDANGEATIKNLAPGKYGVQVVPPNAKPDPDRPGRFVSDDWQQTTTIEGTKVIDAWVAANEPPYFQEFGPPGWHVFVGFVNAGRNKDYVDATVLTGGGTISGRVVNTHLSRPPGFAFYNGAPFPHTTAWVGLNLGAAGEGQGVFAKRCNEDGSFSIPNVPPGDYQLVVWDDNLDIIFAFHSVEMFAGDSEVALGDLPVFNWFTGLWNHVFYDENENGKRDPGEIAIPEQNINLRWRDGTIYQAMPTDTEGWSPFDEVFPFFSWLVAEVDYLRLKATGATIVVDAGGPIDGSQDLSYDGQLNPQWQPDEGEYFRTETGPVLTQAFQGFLGQTSVIEWGKKDYGPGENGGISGMVFYATTRAEDDPQYAAAEVWEPGIPGVQVNLYEADANGQIVDQDENGIVDSNDAIATTWTDSWDDSLPTECPGADPSDPVNPLDKCYDGMRNWNQVRPGVFDGGFAFAGYDAVHSLDGLTAGSYIVEVVPPPGYAIIESHDRNVDFGEEYVPSPMMLPPPCVGDTYVVDDYLRLFPGVEAPLAGQTLNRCDRKLVDLSPSQNAAVDFFAFTEVPPAGQLIGFILDDTANEFDPLSPQFGEKYAPPWLPVSIRDWTGREINRVYSDQYGVYNALVPSTYTTNLPAPSGMSPNMMTTCMNDPRLPDGTSDPNFNPQYSTFCYTFQYMPGATTYLDTPVLPVAAFAGPDQYPLDCEFADGTPKIHQVNGPLGGPYVSGTGQQITIQSEGNVLVPNPAFDGTNAYMINRNYGFGDSEGTVTLGGIPLPITSWSNESITATIPTGASTGQLMVTRNDGMSTVVGVTVTVRRNNDNYAVHHVTSTIQAAIDQANPGDLILIPPGTYEELVIMWKPVRAQGYGAGSTIISAVKSPATKLQDWRLKIQELHAQGAFDLLPGQTVDMTGIEPAGLFNESGSGIIVLARNRNVNQGGFGMDNRTNRPNASIDGLTISGADHGGGIVVNGYAHYLEISNNRIANNSGVYGGGIRLGHPVLTNETNQGVEYQSAYNDNIRIHHNHITLNGGLNGAGGGVSLCTGSDNYAVSANYICGNFSMGGGGGIGHLGLSDGGRIEYNTIIFNEVFNQLQTVNGGGVLIAGGPPLGGPDSLSPGAGSVTVNANLIQGNAANAGDGGGIRTSRVNGEDVRRPNDRFWYRVDMFNNMIVNNLAALAGGGISLFDTARANIIHNTIAHNDSTATASEAFLPLVEEDGTTLSHPQPAGIVSRAHSPALMNAFGPSEAAYSNPLLFNDIIWQNRAWRFAGDPTVPLYELEYVEDWDLGVTGANGELVAQSSILTDGGPDPDFVLPYFNEERGVTTATPEPASGLQATIAFDEGGNFIRVRFGPLTLVGDYHIDTANTGQNLVGTYPLLGTDYDGDPRGASVDIGADEIP